MRYDYVAFVGRVRLRSAHKSL